MDAKELERYKRLLVEKREELLTDSTRAEVFRAMTVFVANRFF